MQRTIQGHRLLLGESDDRMAAILVRIMLVNRVFDFPALGIPPELNPPVDHAAVDQLGRDAKIGPDPAITLYIVMRVHPFRGEVPQSSRLYIRAPPELNHELMQPLVD